MIRYKLCVLAEGVVEDAQTKTISIFSVVEEITAQGFPLFIPKIALFVLWERDLTDPARYDAEFSVTLNQERLNATPVSLDFRDTRRHRSIVNVQGLVIPQPGQLVFSISIRIQNGPEATYTLSVAPPQSVIGSTGSSGSG